MDRNQTLDSILEDLYAGNAPEEGTADTAQPAAAPAPAPAPAEAAKPEEDMSDEELALAVSVDPEEAKPEEAPAEEKGKEKAPADPAPKKKTADEIKRIREEAEADVRALRKAFPELAGIRGLGELQDPGKYLSYRRKGLTAEEAYTLAYAGVKRRESQAGGVKKPDLRSSPSSGGTPNPNAPTAKELREFMAQTNMPLEEAKKYYRKF